MTETIANALHYGKEIQAHNDAIEKRIAEQRWKVEQGERNIEVLEGRLMTELSFHVVAICAALAQGKTVVTHDVFLKHFKELVSADEFTERSAEMQLFGEDITAALLNKLPGCHQQYAVVIDPAALKRTLPSCSLTLLNSK